MTLNVNRKGDKMRTPMVGSISSGTLRTEDLLLAFAAELGWQGAGYLEADDAKLYDAALEIDPDSEDAGYLLQELTERLESAAPIYTYFGTLEGDGAHFGYWLDHEALREAIDESEPGEESGEYINNTDGVRISVSDHGNVEIYSLETGTSLMSIV